MNRVGRAEGNVRAGMADGPLLTYPRAIVVGCSTGGPDALQALLTAIDPPLNVPMFIVQHMPAKFTFELAGRLNDKVTSTVVEAEEGVIAKPGVCYVAPGGRHMKLRRLPSRGVAIVLNDTERINSCRPSVEPLFESAGRVYGKHLAAVVLTGMGRDGVGGAGELAQLGCPIIAQDEDSSVVWGMPGSVVQADLASEVLPLDQIGSRLSALSKRGWPPIRDSQRVYAGRRTT